MGKRVSNADRRDGWKWRVTCYYGPEAKRPKRPGAVAIETVHKSDHSKDMEVAAGEARDDIGSVVVTRVARS